MLRHLVIAIMALVGDAAWSRPVICIAIAAAFLAIVYLLALPVELPEWPIYTVLGVAAAIGFIWDRYSRP